MDKLTLTAASGPGLALRALGRKPALTLCFGLAEVLCMPPLRPQPSCLSCKQPAAPRGHLEARGWLPGALGGSGLSKLSWDLCLHVPRAHLPWN